MGDDGGRDETKSQTAGKKGGEGEKGENLQERYNGGVDVGEGKVIKM